MVAGAQGLLTCGRNPERGGHPCPFSPRLSREGRGSRSGAETPRLQDAELGSPTPNA